MDKIISVCSFIKAYGLVGFLVLAIIYLGQILLDEDRSALLRARFFKVLHALTHKREAEKKFISNDINGRLNLARRGLHFGSEVLPRSVKVDWVSGSSSQTYDLKEGEFVVRLDPAECQQTNIVRLATAIVQRTSCLGVRHLMEKPMLDAIDLNLVRIVLRQVGDRKILDWFFCNEYQPRVGKDNQLSKWNDCIGEIDERGLFTRIFLVELDAFAKRIQGMKPRPYMMGELEGLAEFLYRIATKDLGQDVPLEYLKAHIRIGILLVARTSKLLGRGVKPYVRAMNHVLRKELDNVYVLISDKELLGKTDPEARDKFVQLTESLEKEILQSSLITKEFESTYACTDGLGRRRKAKCIRYTISTAA